MIDTIIAIAVIIGCALTLIGCYLIVFEPAWATLRAWGRPRRKTFTVESATCDGDDTDVVVEEVTP